MEKMIWNPFFLMKNDLDLTHIPDASNPIIIFVFIEEEEEVEEELLSCARKIFGFSNCFGVDTFIF